MENITRGGPPVRSPSNASVIFIFPDIKKCHQLFNSWAKVWISILIYEMTGAALDVYARTCWITAAKTNYRDCFVCACVYVCVLLPSVKTERGDFLCWSGKVHVTAISVTSVLYPRRDCCISTCRDSKRCVISTRSHKCTIHQRVHWCGERGTWCASESILI